MCARILKHVYVHLETKEKRRSSRRINWIVSKAKHKRQYLKFLGWPYETLLVRRTQVLLTFYIVLSDFQDVFDPVGAAVATCGSWLMMQRMTALLNVISLDKF